MNDRKEYAYLLCIGGEIKQLIAKWWSIKEIMEVQKSAMWATARLFKKTAAVLVYEHSAPNSEVWTFADSFQWSNWYFPQEITITADNRIYND